MSALRQSIYYWKCDRPAALHGTEAETTEDDDWEGEFARELSRIFEDPLLRVKSAGGQGNHRTFFVTTGGKTLFARVEDGPEGDSHMEVEARILELVRAKGLPAPQVHWMDTSRSVVPVAYQVMEFVPHPDLNALHRKGLLDLLPMAARIGTAVARWQQIPVSGFGPFDIREVRKDGRLRGFHDSYAFYYHLNLEKHLGLLVERGFWNREQARRAMALVDKCRDLLELKAGCLVHKDLALWNMLGTPSEIRAFIDWDDAIAGDIMDDFSLLGCFYDGGILGSAIRAYAEARPLPGDHARRFWLHLLRNMIVKAVIRTGAGYFDRSDNFFLRPYDGEDLKRQTERKLEAAMRGLEADLPLEAL